MTDPFVTWAIEVRLNRIRMPLMIFGWLLSIGGVLFVIPCAVCIIWMLKSSWIFPARIGGTAAIVALCGWWLRTWLREGELWEALARETNR